MVFSGGYQCLPLLANILICQSSQGCLISLAQEPRERKIRSLGFPLSALTCLRYILANPLKLEAKAWHHVSPSDSCSGSFVSRMTELRRWTSPGMSRGPGGLMGKGLRTLSGNGLGLIEKSVPGRVVVQRARPAASCLLVACFCPSAHCSRHCQQRKALALDPSELLVDTE